MEKGRLENRILDLEENVVRYCITHFALFSLIFFALRCTIRSTTNCLAHYFRLKRNELSAERSQLFQNGPSLTSTPFARQSSLQQELEAQEVGFFSMIINNYWLRLSMMWRIIQREEEVIVRGRSWITASLICIILHIKRKTNLIIILLFVQNISKFLTTTLPPRSLSSARFQNFQQLKELQNGVFTFSCYFFWTKKLIVCGAWKEQGIKFQCFTDRSACHMSTGQGMKDY